VKFGGKPLFMAATLILSVSLAACTGPTGSNSGTGGGGGGGGTGAGSFTVGGTVTGLTGTGLVLQDNGGDNLAITGNGPFTFKTAVAQGGAYLVTISTQPSSPTQVCAVTNGNGAVNANITGVQVTCQTPSLAIGGTVTGVKGTGLVLENNGGDDLSITADGSFTFKTLLLNNAPYAVTVKTQPSGPSQNCTVSNGNGIATANVTNVQVVCPIPTYTIGGTVVGLLGNGGGMELQDNGGDNLPISSNGPFTFATPITFGGAYNANIFIQPTTQPQICIVAGGSGTATAIVNNIVVDCGHGDWTWITGSSSSNAAGLSNNPPTIPAPPTQDTNSPGARNDQITWTDPSGNLWMFSGFGFSFDNTIKIQPLYLDELWMFKGAPDYNCLANGCLPRPGNGWVLVKPVGAAPDARTGATAWTDASGKLWLFGGQDGEGGNVPLGLVNDLWNFDPATSTWTLVSGTPGFNAPGVYGTRGVASASNIPGARWGANSWVDASGNFWIFGGLGFDSTDTNGLLNDLWEFNTSTSQWIWMGPSASSSANQNGIYGTQGTAAAANAPGGRQSAASWTDKGGNFWLFGGFGLDATGTPNGTISDLWKLDFSTKQWTWVAGSNAANQHGVYGTQGATAAANAPGARWRAAAWTDHNGNLWLFSGFGLDTTGTGLLNDLWEYTLVPTSAYPTANQWTWVKGANTNSNAGVYGNASVPLFSNVPGSRWGAGYWIDTSNELWIFGGQGYASSSGSGNGLLNDFWRFLPYP
jgi:Galactose oxidase, central domain